MTRAAFWRSRRKGLSLRMRVLIAALVAIVVSTVSFGGGLVASGVADSKLHKWIADGAGGLSGIAFLGHIYNVDLPGRQAQISWLIIGCGTYKVPNTSAFKSQSCGRLNKLVNVYIDGSSEPNTTYDPGLLPIVKSTGIVEAMAETSSEFQGDHLLHVESWFGLDQQYSYPFDKYSLDTTFVVADGKTNETLPILQLTPVDTTNNFTPFLDMDSETTITPDGEKQMSARTMFMHFQRTNFTRAFVMSLFITNWALTLVVVFITISGFTGHQLNESILVMPLSVILTIPSLRTLWVGAPAFGLILDACGMFLQMVIVSLCSIVLVVMVGLSKRRFSILPPPPGQDSEKQDYKYTPVDNTLDVPVLEKAGYDSPRTYSSP